MNEKRYLKWYNKIGYGSGDIAGNVVYAFLTFFVMIYLTDTVGLNPGIVGGLTAIYLQSTLEWVMKQQVNFIQMMILFAMLSILSKYCQKFAAGEVEVNA